jgi:hypothetical protein
MSASSHIQGKAMMMKKSLTAVLLVLAATTASAGMPAATALPLVIAGVEAAPVSTSRRARANAFPVAEMATDEVRPRRPRAGVTTIFVSIEAEPQPRRARANGIFAAD